MNSLYSQLGGLQGKHVFSQLKETMLFFEKKEKQFPRGCLRRLHPS